MRGFKATNVTDSVSSNTRLVTILILAALACASIFLVSKQVQSKLLIYSLFEPQKALPTWSSVSEQLQVALAERESLSVGLESRRLVFRILPFSTAFLFIDVNTATDQIQSVVVHQEEMEMNVSAFVKLAPTNGTLLFLVSRLTIELLVCLYGANPFRANDDRSAKICFLSGCILLAFETFSIIGPYALIQIAEATPDSVLHIFA